VSDAEALVRTLFARADGFAYLIEGAFERKRDELPTVTDLRWSADGRKLAVCLGSVTVLSRSGEDSASVPVAAHDNAAGTVQLVAARGWKGVPARAGNPHPISLDFGKDGRAVTAWSDGSIRNGIAADAPRWTTIADVERIRIARDSGTLAGVGGGRLVLLAPDAAEPREIAEGVDPIAIAWSPDGDTLAFGAGRDLVLVDASGHERSRTPIGNGNPLRLSWRGSSLLVSTGATLHEIPADGSARLIGPLGVEGAQPIAIVATPGRYAIAAWQDSVRRALAVVDLDSGAVAVVPWETRLRTEHPIELSPTGDALTWVDGYGILQLVAWGEATSDPENERIERAAALSNAGQDEEALALLQGVTLRPSMMKAAAALQGSIEDRRKERRKNAPVVTPKAPPPPVRPIATAPFDIGERVRHTRFGEGTVEDIEGSGTNAKLTVDFDGTQRILAAALFRKI
jgi:hypothetical protein